MATADALRKMLALGLSIEQAIEVVAAMEAPTRREAPTVQRPIARRPSHFDPEWQRLRREVFERDGHRCVYCGDALTPGEEECDHVIPLSRGGPTSLDNLATACGRCNRSKKDRLVTEWVRP